MNQGFHNSALRQDPLSLKVGFSLGLPQVASKLADALKTKEGEILK